MVNKYKIGDKVKVLDGSKIKSSIWWIPGMNRYVGETYTVWSIDYANGTFVYRIEARNSDKIHLDFAEEWLNPADGDEQKTNTAKPENNIDKIVIYFRGDETVAQAIDKNGRIVESASANRSPEDEYDMFTGAKVALTHLKNKTFSGKAVFIGKDKRFDVGKIYLFDNGAIIAPSIRFHAIENCKECDLAGYGFLRIID